MHRFGKKDLGVVCLLSRYPPQGLPFKSLLCYPLNINDGPMFAAICIDSRLPKAFDARVDRVWDTIKDPASRLVALLHAFQRVRSQVAVGRNGECSQENAKKIPAVPTKSKTTNRESRK